MAGRPLTPPVEHDDVGCRLGWLSPWATWRAVPSPQLTVQSLLLAWEEDAGQCGFISNYWFSWKAEEADSIEGLLCDRRVPIKQRD